MIYDQLIIGCGIAGLNELRRALQENKNVCVVAKNFGATTHLTGAFRKDLTQDFFDFYGVPGVSGEEILAIGPIGQIRSIGGALKTQAITQHEMARVKKVLFMGIEGLPDFPASLIVPNLKKSFLNVTQAKFSNYDLNITSPHAHILQILDDEKGFDAIVEFLGRQKQDYDLVVIPPVLGIRNFISLYERLEKTLGTRVVEMLSTTPPVAGLRFTECIKRFFVERKVNVVWGKVVGFEKEGNRITKVVVHNDTQQTIQAKEFVLATGKFVGGGLVFEDGVWEAIFDLPCSTGDGFVSKKTPMTHLITRNPAQEQDFLRLGVLVDQGRRIIDPISKHPIFENLRAVGLVSAGQECQNNVRN